MRYLILFLLLITTDAFAANAGDRKEDNPNQDKDIIFQVNRGGTPNTTVMTIKGASGGSDVVIAPGMKLQADAITSSTGAAPSGAIPPGTIVSYIGTTAPAGWLMCDGTSYLRSTYPNLATALGCSTNCAFGQADSTHFYVDFRGMLLRPKDGGRGYDGYRASRSSLNGGNSGDNVGSYEPQGTAVNGAYTTNSLSISSPTYATSAHHHVDAMAMRSGWHMGPDVLYGARNCYGLGGTNSDCPYIWTTQNIKTWYMSGGTPVATGSPGSATDIMKTSYPDYTNTLSLGGSVGFSVSNTETHPWNTNVNYIIKY